MFAIQTSLLVCKLLNDNTCKPINSKTKELKRLWTC